MKLIFAFGITGMFPYRTIKKGDISFLVRSKLLLLWVVFNFACLVIKMLYWKNKWKTIFFNSSIMYIFSLCINNMSVLITFVELIFYNSRIINTFNSLYDLESFFKKSSNSKTLTLFLSFYWFIVLFQNKYFHQHTTFLKSVVDVITYMATFSKLVFQCYILCCVKGQYIILLSHLKEANYKHYIDVQALRTIRMKHLLLSEFTQQYNSLFGISHLTATMCIIALTSFLIQMFISMLLKNNNTIIYFWIYFINMGFILSFMCLQAYCLTTCDEQVIFF